jgi:death-on-curing protein
MVLALHDESAAQFGGASGVRDEGLLDSALARPRNLYAYEPDTATLPKLAAAYGSGIIRNHPFVDGNKRTGLLAMAVFLRLNGHELAPDEAQEVATIVELASGELSDESLVRWVEANTRPV